LASKRCTFSDVIASSRLLPKTWFEFNQACPRLTAYSAMDRYAGGVYVVGAPLAAGGWHADGESLGVFIHTLAQYGYLMPESTARQLWDLQWWNMNQDRAAGWAYGLGW
jgi:hypothetical protein